MTESYWIYY